jgi:hypothetical protein
MTTEEVKQLRLGNLILPTFSEIPRIVKGISIHFLWINNDMEHTIGPYEIEDFRFIPLTEEWLIKFGFGYNRITKRRYIEYYRLGDSNQSVLFVGKDKQIGFWYGVQNHTLDTVAINSVQYVHQLQNLYFALTGKELTI